MQLQFKQGPLFGIYVIYVSGCLLTTYLVLYQRWRTARGDDKNRIAYVFFGVLSATAIAALINLYIAQQIPLSTSLSRIGLYGGLLLIGSVSIAIIRHHLMDIEVVIKRTLVFAGLAGSILGLFALVTFLARDLLAWMGLGWFWSNLISAILIIALYDPIKQFLINITDRFLFQKKYDYKEAIRKFTAELITELQLSKLVQRIAKVLTDTLRVTHCAVVLHEHALRAYRVSTSTGLAQPSEVMLEMNHPFIGLCTKSQTLLTREQVQKEIPNGEVKKVFDLLKMELCIPLIFRKELVGFISLGKKKSDEEYTEEDKELLSTLINQGAIAINNAVLFAEAEHQQKLAMIGTLTSAIHHEVNNPLNIIRISADYLKMMLDGTVMEGKSEEEKQKVLREKLEEIEKQCLRAAQTVTNLATFAKPEHEPKEEVVEVAKSVESVLSVVGHELSMHQIQVSKEIENGLKVVVDKKQLEEILFNLVKNAGEAISAKGGSASGGKDKGEIRVIGKSIQDGKARIEVHDTGSGIPETILSRIFEPFFTTKSKGSGYGLYIVKKMVERNRGAIEVKSEVGKGTSFFLEFPGAKED